MITTKQAFQEYGVSRQWLYMNSNKLTIRQKNVGGRIVNFYNAKEILKLINKKKYGSK